MITCNLIVHKGPLVAVYVYNRRVVKAPLQPLYYVGTTYEGNEQTPINRLENR